MAHHSGGPEAAAEWLQANYYRIPDALRPEPSDIREFAAFFSTYLISSFDVVERPGIRGAGPTPEFCRCDVCMRIINAPHLQTKKLFAADKRRAKLLMAESVTQLARDNGLSIDDNRAMAIAVDASTRRSAAYVAYGHWLVRRLDGESDGPAILALWRLIAWDPRGGMRRDFKLELHDFKVAKEKVLQAVRNGPSAA